MRGTVSGFLIARCWQRRAAGKFGILPVEQLFGGDGAFACLDE
jgi:hypothetical protein